jgi:hypothetical protein
MRGLCFGAVAFWVLAASATSRDAEADKEARALLDKAIQVAGGEAKLAKLKAVTLKTKAKIRFGDGETNFSGVCSFVGLDRFSIEGEAGGSTLHGVLSPKGAWLKLGARVEEAIPDYVPSLRKLLKALRAAHLLLPLRDKAVTLSHLGEIKVGDRPAVGVKASSKDHGEWDCFFDKETGLPAKFETRLVLGRSEIEVPLTCVFSDYQEVEGRKNFTKITFNVELDEFKIHVEATLSDVKPAVKLEDERFAKPD